MIPTLIVPQTLGASPLAQTFSTSLKSRELEPWDFKIYCGTIWHQ